MYYGELAGLSGLELEFLIKNARRLRFDSLINMPYWLVKVEIPELLGSGDVLGLIESLARCISCEVDQRAVEGLGIGEVLGFVLWVRDELEQISHLEAMHLQTPTDTKLVKAGIKRLEVLGEINVIDSLAGGDILKWACVKALPYSEVFDKLLKMKIEYEVQAQLRA